MTEKIIVAAIVLVTVIVLAVKFYRDFKRPGGCSGCKGSCKKDKSK